MADQSRDRSMTGMSGLEGLLASVGFAGGPAKPRPVERWNPPFCGDIDMRIAADGTWFYQGSSIGRIALVKLFASILRKDPDRHVLVTPVERVGIVVDDAPFLAVEMAVDGKGRDRTLSFRTNVDDVVSVAAEHRMRFEGGFEEGLKPYIRVRGDLWARVTRALTYDLVELGEERAVDGKPTFGVVSGGEFFAIAPAQAIEGL